MDSRLSVLFNPERQQTLAKYYIKTNRHLSPNGVEIGEFNEKTGDADMKE